MSAALQYLILQWSHTSWLEITAVIFAVAEVLLAYKNKIWLYPAGIISTCIYVWIYVQPEVKLYADASLNSYYLAMSIYGWIVWQRRRGGHSALSIGKCNKKDWLITIGIVVSAFFLLFFILKYLTDSNTPLADALVSAIAWSGMWLLARKKIENWILLNISNTISIPLLLYKHLPLTALLTVFLFVVAVFGYLKWLKIMKKEINNRAKPTFSEKLKTT